MFMVTENIHRKGRKSMAKYFGIFIIMVILLCAGCNKQDNESEKNEQSTSYGETQEEMQEVTQ